MIGGSAFEAGCQPALPPRGRGAGRIVDLSFARLGARNGGRVSGDCSAISRGVNRRNPAYTTTGAACNAAWILRDGRRECRAFFSSGSRLYTIGLGDLRFMLPDRTSSPMSVRSIAPPVLAHPDGRRILFNVSDWQRCRAVRLNLLTSRPQLGGDAAGDRARELTCVGPGMWRSLHVKQHGETKWQKHRSRTLTKGRENES